MTAIELMAPSAALLRARQKRPSPMLPATTARAKMVATSLWCLIPLTTYSALEVACVFGVPPSGGKVWGLDAIPPEGGTPNFCCGGPFGLAFQAPALVLRQSGGARRCISAAPSRL